MTHICVCVGGCVHFQVESQELHYLGPGHDVSKFQKRHVIRSCTDECLSQDDEHELALCTVVVVMVSVWLSVPVYVCSLVKVELERAFPMTMANQIAQRYTTPHATESSIKVSDWPSGTLPFASNL
jgi:hypothetical protein